MELSPQLITKRRSGFPWEKNQQGAGRVACHINSFPKPPAANELPTQCPGYWWWWAGLDSPQTWQSWGLRHWVKAKQPSASRTRLSVKKRKWKHLGGSPKTDSHQLFISVHFPYHSIPLSPQNHPAPRLPQGSRFPLPQRTGALRSTDAQHAHLDPSHAGGGVVTIAVAHVELVGLGYGVRVGDPGVGMVVLGMTRCLLF